MHHNQITNEMINEQLHQIDQTEDEIEKLKTEMQEKYNQWQWALEQQKKAEMERDKVLSKAEIEAAKEQSVVCQKHYEEVKLSIMKMIMD